MAKHVVIVGGGFGGLEAAFSLADLLDSGARITLIDRSGRHSFIPSIHEVIANKINARDIQIPLDVVLGPAGVRFLQDEVLSVHPGQREIVTMHETLGYDYLVLAAGAENSFLGVPGAGEFSFRFRTPEDAKRIKAELDLLLEDRGRECAIVVAGGGTEGVEVAGELMDLVEDGGYGEGLESGRITVELLQGRPRLLPELPPRAQDIAEEYLTGRGVKLLTGNRITEVGRGAMALDSGERRDFSLLIWTGGIQPAPLIRDLTLPRDSAGWLVVNDRLQSTGDDHVFGVGDAVSIHGPSGPLRLPRLAYHAMDQASVASMNIRCHMKGRRLMAYSPKPKPQLISMGKDMGILVQGRGVLAGRWVVAVKKAVQVGHMMGFLTRPVLSPLTRRVPGAASRHRLRQLLPV